MNKLRILAELWLFTRERKKYVFLPIIIFLLVLLAFALVAEVPVLTPFIYALF